MKCPYCDSEMEQGDIFAGRGAYWVRKDRGFFIVARKSKGDITIVRQWSSDPYVNSYLCWNCGKVIMDVSIPQD